MYFHFPTFAHLLKTTYTSKNFHPLHASYATVLIALFLLVRSGVQLSEIADDLLFTDYKKQSVTAPIFITGNPRSGTTFLHRILAKDPQFTTTDLYQTIFPTVSFYRLFEKLNFSGCYLNQWIELINKKSFGGWQGIHKTDLNEPEEDETIFVWTLLTPVLFLFFPFPHILDKIGWVDQLPERERHQLMTYYKTSLQRHLYATGKDKTLLIKNTTSTGRLRSMLETLPDMRVIHLIRHPYQAIPSLLSMYAKPWQTLVPQTNNNNQAYYLLAQLYADYYRTRKEIFEELQITDSRRLIEIAYEDFTAEPLETITSIYQQWNLTLSDSFRNQLEEKFSQSSSYRSGHQYSLEEFGLTEKMIYNMMPDVFEFYQFQP